MGAKKESAGMRFLYHTVVGRACLKLLACRGFSALTGHFLDSSLSKPLISRFVKKNGIDLAEFEADHFHCFNDCFARKIKAGRRPIAEDPDVLISPCDGLLSVYPVQDGTVLPIKQSQYTIASLLRDEALAEKYLNGYCFVFRLCVNHYHRYCYPADGEKGENVFLAGRLHTVRPIALERYPVFTENCREYTTIRSERFGTLTQMEVGAMLVGKIRNLHGAKSVLRGEEKGMFLYGGSTIVLLVEKDVIASPDMLLRATANGEETPVRMGEALAKKLLAK